MSNRKYEAKRSRPGSRKYKKTKAKKWPWFLCGVLILLLGIYFVARGKKIDKSQAWREMKSVSESLIEHDEKIYETRSGELEIDDKNKSIDKEEKSEKDTLRKNKLKNNEYEKKDRDYLDGLIKKKE